MNTALATAEYLPQGAVWIHRQMKSDFIDHKLVICNTLTNEDVFPHPNILCLGEESYTKRAIKHKLRFWFGHRPIRLGKKQKDEVKRALISNNIELLHVHFGTYAVYLIDICKELNIPVVVTFHGFDLTSAPKRWPAYKKALVELFSKVAFVLVISEDMAERVIRMGCPENKVKVSYLGVPTDQFDVVDRSHREKITFLHAGRLTEKKGVPDLITAFAKAFRGKNNIQLHIAGGGEELSLIEQRIKDETISDQVTLLGNLSQNDLKDAYYNADVFVLNSRTDSKNTKEGLPISTLEACSTGLPVISTYHAGIPESINHEETGLLVNEFDTEGLSVAMQAMESEATRNVYGTNARAYMEQKFDLHRCNKVLSDIYIAAIQANHQTTSH